MNKTKKETRPISQKNIVVKIFIKILVGKLKNVTGRLHTTIKWVLFHEHKVS